MSKKQKSNERPLFSQLPHEILSIVIAFCDTSDLFHSIPLICKSVHKFLKRETISPEQMKEMAIFNASMRGAAIQGRAKISFKKFLQSFTANEENRIWKQRCVTVSPSLNIGSNHLICYKRVASRVLAQKLGLARPKYLKLSDTCTFLKQNLEKIQKRNHELMYIILHHEKSESSEQVIERRWEKLQEFYQELAGEMKARPAPFSSTKRIVAFDVHWKPIPSLLRIAEHELDMIKFLRDTSIVTRTSNENSDKANVTLLSPKNGNWVSITLKAETKVYQAEPDDWYCDLTRSKFIVELLNERRNKKSCVCREESNEEQNNYNLVEATLSLSPLLNHMGIEPKETLKKCLWMVIKPALEQATSGLPLVVDVTHGINYC